MTTNIQKVLFDLDGVLADTKPIQFLALRRAVYDYCNIAIDATPEMTYDQPTRLKLEILADQGIINRAGIEWIYGRKKDITDDYYRSDLTEAKDKQALFNFLSQQGIRAAVVTNANRRSANLLLEKIGVANQVDFLITNEDVVSAKPHPEPYIRAMLRFGGNLEDFIILEDSDAGIAAAQASGARYFRVSDPSIVNVELLRRLLSGDIQAKRAA